MFLHAEVKIDSTNNSTPYFLAPPITYLPVNTQWTYNPLPFDANGDSLVWSLDTPHTGYGIQCAGYVLPEDTRSLELLVLTQLLVILTGLLVSSGTM